MRYTHEPDGGRIALAALAGAAIGAGVALLYAPKPGAALRGEIGRSVGSLQEAVGEHYHDLAERAHGLAERATSAIEQVNGTAGRAVAAVERGTRHFAKVSERARATAKYPAIGRIDASEPF